MSNLEALIHKYYDAFNTRNFAAYAELFSADTLTEAPGLLVRGLEAARAFDQSWIEAFPEARIESMRMTAAGSTLVTGNWLHGGKQRGVLHTPAGDLPASGAELQAPYCSLFEVGGGRITRQKLLFEPSFVALKLAQR